MNEAVFSYEFVVPATAVDANGHVNNVIYVQWMQDAAMQHYDAIGGTDLTRDLEATWVIRSHKVEYLRPAFEGERIRVQTWVANLHRVRLLRRYSFMRAAEGEELVRGETEWVFVEAKTGSPRAIPDGVAGLFRLARDAAKS